jgi:putative transposase
MRQTGIEGCHRRRSIRTTQRGPEEEPVPDRVQRNFNPKAPNLMWVADFTYVPTLAGFLFLAVVLDAFSRRVIGWSMGPRPTMELVMEALDMAIWNRKAEPGVIHQLGRQADAPAPRCQLAGLSSSAQSTKPGQVQTPVPRIQAELSTTGPDAPNPLGPLVP